MPLPTCIDKAQNGDETDTDCGGKVCPKCADGKKCKAPADCKSGVCTGGICAAATCTDKVMNGAETDVDCGGGSCPACADTKKCKAATDCKSGVCDPKTGLCLAPTCTDKVKNGDETDTDCGGKTCPTCANKKKCKANADCASGLCDPKTGLCLAATCTDKVQNGTETDVDCGGASCPACADTKKCKAATDCKSGVCDPKTGLCLAPTCTDKVMNGDESDTDCGGKTCPKCADTKKCKGNSDCASNVCLNSVCQKPTCVDFTKNGDETDIDCGGKTCPKCINMKKCKVGADCLSGVCDPVSGLCAAPKCTDKVQNGDETDTDCGGATCPACVDGKKCKNHSDCTSGVCDPKTGLCLTPTCTDKTQNGDETDTDCGGKTCPKCADKKKCKAAADCKSGVCDAVSGQCAAPKCTDKVMNGTETDIDCGGTCPACADGKKCGKAADCKSGVCDATSGLCLAPTCTDKVKNGTETDIDCGGTTCTACAVGKACKYSFDCDKGVCDKNKCRLPVSCDELHKGQPKLPSGTYSVVPDAAGTLTVTCDMTTHSGGWTLVGSVVNGVTRKWKTAAVFSNTTTFGTAAAAKTNNFKSAAWSRVAGNDLMLATPEYTFGFTKMLGSKAFGPYIKAKWPSSCAKTWIRSGADFSTKLSSTQQLAISFALRAWDDNASCFPGFNENSAVSFQAATCCWVGGLGNNPSGPSGNHPWYNHDLSLLKLSNLKPETCTKNSYPCNANGYRFSQTYFCYPSSCKVKYALVYVR